VNDRITIRLGDLSFPLAKWCAAYRCSPSEAIRAAVAKMLRVEAPEMPQGNPGIGDLAADGAAARWKAKRKRRK
jgi:hypothetical protein